ncbi:hypothetical protein B0J17DRAFT_768445 [Rhizoctonia solani]|nr:hypothetical protein B0J17DRAFT_768445 [Rhizoctonia solani]
MADFFTSTSTFVAPVDKAFAQKAQQTDVQTSSMTNQSSETTHSTKASGSNFSMCEIIM